MHNQLRHLGREVKRIMANAARHDEEAKQIIRDKLAEGWSAKDIVRHLNMTLPDSYCHSMNLRLNKASFWRVPDTANYSPNVLLWQE